MTINDFQSLWIQYRWPFALFLALFLGFWIHSRLAIYLSRRRGLRQKKLGEAAEKKARKILERAGYKILEAQPVFDAELLVDQDHRYFQVTPDFLVSRAEQVYVVEVKRTDGDAIARASNRRQVLEYLFATDLPCLLVNMRRKEVQIIDFPLITE